MSEQPKDGGPAFPIPGMDGVQAPYDGMSLRDWFAGQALIGLSSKPEGTLQTDARFAYDSADAMLAERAKFYEVKR